MSLDVYEAFVQVVEQGSVSAAARVLGVPRPTVSRRVARLEERLGERLVRRGAREVTVTRVGRTLYQRIRGPMDKLAAAEREVLDRSDAPRGLLRVAVPPALTHSLTPLWARLMDSYPEVELEVLSETRFVELTDEGFDVALRGGRSSNPDLVQRKLMTTRAGLWAAPSYLARFGTPRHVQDLASHRLLRGYTSRNEPQKRWPLVDGGSFAVSGPFSSNDTTQLRGACADGLGIALLSEIPPLHPSLVSLLPEVGLTLHLHVIYPERALLPPRVRAFIDLAVPFFQGWQTPRT
ncbi:MAG: LysR family transcriptional regulator [Deltaproteobacteria bacterium]|nr:LysR family transcriptional regulator [Deltaproteobacteria bacterium]